MIFFVQFCVFFLPLLNIFCFYQVHTISVIYCAHLCMKISLGISNFLEEIPSFSNYIFLYFFALITEEGFLISPCYSLELCIQMGISFFFSFAFHSSSVQFSSVAQSCLTLCDPMNHSTPGLPVHHQLLSCSENRYRSYRNKRIDFSEHSSRNKVEVLLKYLCKVLSFIIFRGL